MSENEMSGRTFWRGMPPPAFVAQPTPPLTEEQIRDLVREQVEKELYPGAIDARQYRHVQITDDDGTRWRGLVYLVEKTE